MKQSKEALLERVLEGYARYFNTKKDIVLEGLPVAAEAEYHSRDEKYVLLRQAQLWAAESNEYVFFVLAEHLTEEQLNAYYKAILDEGMSRVKPEGAHMCSYVTMIVFADEVEEGVMKAAKKLKFTKNFLFSFKGWAQFRVGVYDLSQEKWATNSIGSDIPKSIERMR